jgi:hypothetical protein
LDAGQAAITVYIYSSLCSPETPITQDRARRK